MVRVVLCGTHPSQYNGYSKVVYELSKYLGKCSDVDLTVFAFQNFYDRDEHHVERQLPPTVKVYDVCKYENPKNKGFGEALIVPFLQEVDPDIVIVYNDHRSWAKPGDLVDQLAQNLLANLYLPAVTSLVVSIFIASVSKASTSSALTQEQQEAKYEPPDFKLSERFELN